jgi:hypothetical protein
VLSKNGTKLPEYEEFDDITCMTIEIQYQKWLKRKKDGSSRYLKLSETETIDFKSMELIS